MILVISGLRNQPVGTFALRGEEAIQCGLDAINYGTPFRDVKPCPKTETPRLQKESQRIEERIDSPVQDLSAPPRRIVRGAIKSGTSSAA
jgi:hypothetical protein